MDKLKELVALNIELQERKYANQALSDYRTDKKEIERLKKKYKEEIEAYQNCCSVNDFNYRLQYLYFRVNRLRQALNYWQ